MEKGDIAVLIPTLNESETIRKTIDEFAQNDQIGKENIYVIDGGSEDNTVTLADQMGVEVFTQSGTGKGQAVMEGVDFLDTYKAIIMVDGDQTYLGGQVHQFVRALDRGYDQVIGNRFADMESDAMSSLNQTGNHLINRLFTLLHREDLKDILSGYRAFTVESFKEMHLTEQDFGIETEMSVEAIRQGHDVSVVPITYRSRPDGSSTNLHPILDGFDIIMSVGSLARRHNPFLIFGLGGILSILIGSGLGSWILWEWFVQGVPHEVLSVVTFFLLMIGTQMILVGFLADLIVDLHEELMQNGY